MEEQNSKLFENKNLSRLVRQYAQFHVLECKPPFKMLHSLLIVGVFEILNP